jgi:hypothetical protein
MLGWWLARALGRHTNALSPVIARPTIGVDGQVAAAGQVGAVAGAFNMLAAQRVGFGGAGVEFGLQAKDPPSPVPPGSARVVNRERIFRSRSSSR